jgi:hypothetical protein
MWPRVVEVMLGVWLALSPFIFGHLPEEAWRWGTDFGASTAVILLALLSFWTPLRHIHLANFLVGLWLVFFGWYWEGYPAPPALQNDIVTGLLLLMFAIIPNEASRPPKAWREFYSEEFGTRNAE